jgi:hypothetical protein
MRPTIQSRLKTKQASYLRVIIKALPRSPGQKPGQGCRRFGVPLLTLAFFPSGIVFGFDNIGVTFRHKTLVGPDFP